MRKVVPISVLALFFACLAFAQAPSAPPKPAPEMSALKYFLGSWSCSGNAPESVFGPAHKTDSMLTLKTDPNLDGFWIDGMVMEKKTASNKMPTKGMIHIGYDATSKNYVLLWVDNFGTWATETSSGWQGDTMSWSGEQMIGGEKANARDTFVKKSDREFTHKFELTTKGKTETIVEETCKKGGMAAKK